MKRTEFKITKKQQEQLEEAINAEKTIHNQLSIIGAKKHKVWRSIMEDIPDIKDCSLEYDRKTKTIAFCHKYEERSWLEEQKETKDD